MIDPLGADAMIETDLIETPTAYFTVCRRRFNLFKDLEPRLSPPRRLGCSRSNREDGTMARQTEGLADSTMLLENCKKMPAPS